MEKILILLRDQRKYFERLNNGDRRIANPVLYNYYEELLYDEQVKIGRENKKRLSFRRSRNKNRWPTFKTA